MSHQTHQTSSLRVPQLRELPNPGTPVRGETQLGPTRHRHTPLKRDEPHYRVIAHHQLRDTLDKVELESRPDSPTSSKGDQGQGY